MTREQIILDKLRSLLTPKTTMTLEVERGCYREELHSSSA